MQTALSSSTPHRLDQGPRRAQSQPSGAQLKGMSVHNQGAQPRSPRGRLSRSQAGSSLAEVIVAVAIIAVMGAGLIGSLGYGFMATQLARENQRATQILLEKAEVIRLYNWDQFNYTNDFVPKSFVAVYDPQASNNAQGLTYYGTLSLSNFPAGPSYATNLLQIIITLNWTTAGKVPHTRVLTTQVAKNGLQNYVY